MAIARVLQRGQLTIPQEVREKLHLEPGTVVQIQVTGPASFEVKLVPTLTFEQMRSFFQSFEPTGLDVEQAIALGEADAAEEVIAKLASQIAEGEKQIT